MMTKKNFFEQIVSLNLSNEMTEFATHQLEILSRPRTPAPSKTQKINAEIKTAILSALKHTEEGLEIAEIVEYLSPEFPNVEITPNKVSALVGQLVKENAATRIPANKAHKTMYKAVTEDAGV